mgnify:FL=1
MGDIYAIITAVCWSSAVILFDISSKSFRAIEINVIKNFIGIIGFICTIIIFSIPKPILSNAEYVTLVLSGILGIFIADVLFLDSLRRIGSGMSAVISTIYTPMVFFLAFVLFNETINIQTYIGGILVIAGVIVSVYDTPKRSNKNDLYIGLSFGVIAHIFTAYSVLIVKPIMLNNSIVYVALYRFGAGLLATIFILLVINGYESIISTLREGFKDKYILWGSFMGTYLSVIFWLAGYKYTLAGRAAIYNQLSTIFIIILARIFLKESFNFKKIIGLIFAIIGAILVTIG